MRKSWNQVYEMETHGHWTPETRGDGVERAHEFNLQFNESWLRQQHDICLQIEIAK